MSASDFGITIDNMRKMVNPHSALDGIQIGDFASGSDGVGATGSYVCAGQSFPPDALQGYEIILNNVFSSKVTITGNNETTVYGTGLTAASHATYRIRARKVEFSESEVTSMIQEAVGFITSQLPEKYRRILSSVLGEILAHEGQSISSAILGMSSVNPSSLVLWGDVDFNVPYKERFDKFTALDAYTLVGQVVTFDPEVTGLITADYSHDLSSPPKILVNLAKKQCAADMFNRSFSGRTGDEHPIAKAYKEEVASILEKLNEDAMGISEFDELDLIDETAEESSPLRWSENFRVFRES